MITMNPGINACYFTLNDRYDEYTPAPSTYPDLYFVFKIENRLNGNEILFTQDKNQDLGDGTRYNKFLISVTCSATASVDPNAGFIAIAGENEDYLAQWNYEVFACSGPMPLSGTVSIPDNPTYPSVIVEAGRMLFTA
jgi:hypothetical protein